MIVTSHFCSKDDVYWREIELTKLMIDMSTVDRIKFESEKMLRECGDEIPYGLLNQCLILTGCKFDPIQEKLVDWDESYSVKITFLYLPPKYMDEIWKKGLPKYMKCLWRGNFQPLSLRETR